MNAFLLIVPALLLYGLAYRHYARRLAAAFGVDDARPTPAVTRCDGVDYVPTRPHVLFAHHFSAIAAAGPILGPTWAMLYGYVPGVIWIVLGAIVIGAVHDYACLYVSVREGGRSIAEIARRMMGNGAFVLYSLFIVFNLVVVNAVFINTTASSLTSRWPLGDLGLTPDQHLFRTAAGADGRTMALVGGIASTSAIVLTVLAPILGVLIVKRAMRERYAYPLATLLCIGSVLVGFAWPVAPPALTVGGWTITPEQIWVVLIALYVWLAAAVPVWLILQPREFVSVQFLYLGIALLVIAAVAAGALGLPFRAPPADLHTGPQQLGALWPILFVTIACGAVSGFHGLVGSGTTAKQVSIESHARPVGYGGMLGESLLALSVAIALAVGLSQSAYTGTLLRPPDAPPGWQPNPVLAFSLGVAGVCELALGIPKWLGLLFGLLMVEGFVLDTLDVSIRLNRYLLEEIWSVLFRDVPVVLRNYWVNSGLSVALMLALAFTQAGNLLWPIFGAGNQLLASLSLVCVTLWLAANRRPTAYTLVPAVLVGVTTVASLVYLLVARYLPSGKYLLATTDVIFLLLSLGVLFFAWRKWRELRTVPRASLAQAGR